MFILVCPTIELFDSATKVTIFDNLTFDNIFSNQTFSSSRVRLFFKDLLTPDEIAMLMRRIEVAALLSGNFTYTQIEELLGVGRGKITNVQRSLNRDGSGYKTAIKRLLQLRKNKIKKIKKIEKIQSSDFEKLKKKYPLYFLLFNLVDEIGETLDSKKNNDKKALLSTPSLRKSLKNSSID